MGPQLEPSRDGGKGKKEVSSVPNVGGATETILGCNSRCSLPGGTQRGGQFTVPLAARIGCDRSLSKKHPAKKQQKTKQKKKQRGRKGNPAGNSLKILFRRPHPYFTIELTKRVFSDYGRKKIAKMCIWHTNQY